MRMIISAGFIAIMIGGFAAVTAVVFIVQHMFAITVLAVVIGALVSVARRRRRRGLRRSPVHQLSHYPDVPSPQSPAPAGLPRWTVDAMSSTALPSRAPRNLPPRRSRP
jgi:hypothetical protein